MSENQVLLATAETQPAAFTCECKDWVRSACKGLPFYKAHEGKRYCVLHYPDKDKAADFRPVFEAKLKAEDFDFSGVWFPQAVNFSFIKFNQPANFSSATFSAAADFRRATFNDKANFSSSTFSAKAYFSSTTFAEADFSSTTFAEADFSFATFSAVAYFSSATFSAVAIFSSSTFSAVASFSEATFSAVAIFSSTTFSAKAYFSSTTFSAKAIFSSTTFSAKAYFSSTTFAEADFSSTTFAEADFSFATFSAEAYFSSATFSAEAYFSSATFSAEADFREVQFKSVFFRESKFNTYVWFSGKKAFTTASSLDLQHARIEKPERVSFHTLTLRPQWFINTDARKYDFTNVDWVLEKNVKAEIKKITGRQSPHRLLAIACRYLALNAEENHRYEESSKFRYYAMEAQRLAGRRLANFLLWLYWLASGYGERISRAFFWLIAVWAVFALLYTQVGFTPEETSKPAAILTTTEAQETVTQTTTQNATGIPLHLKSAMTYSFAVMALQKPEPKPLTNTAKALVTFETILGPLQAALLALAIRRKFMR